MNIKFLKANNGDCFLISLNDENGNQRHIVVDSGMPQTYYHSSENSYGDFKNKVVRPLSEAGQKIDLFILTHIDEDHIGGIWNWIAKEKESAYKLIESIWFNSGKSIADEFKLSENPLLQHKLEIFGSFKTSVKQAVTFEEYINTHGLWDKQLIEQGQEYEKFGIKFKILSPGIKQLKDLVGHYKGEVKDDYFTSAEPLDYKSTIKSFIEEEADEKWKFTEDDTKTNGSAIAFIMQHEEKDFLFMADAHPSVVLDELKELKYTVEKPLRVEFMKISHHASSFNTHKDLLDHIHTNHYIISTSGQKHSHPHKRTIARIVKRNPKAKIYFNYPELIPMIWKEQDILDYPEVTLKGIALYPEDL